MSWLFLMFSKSGCLAGLFLAASKCNADLWIWVCLLYHGTPKPYIKGNPQPHSQNHHPRPQKILNRHTKHTKPSHPPTTMHPRCQPATAVSPFRSHLISVRPQRCGKHSTHSTPWPECLSAPTHRNLQSDMPRFPDSPSRSEWMTWDKIRHQTLTLDKCQATLPVSPLPTQSLPNSFTTKLQLSSKQLHSITPSFRCGKGHAQLHRSQIGQHQALRNDLLRVTPCFAHLDVIQHDHIIELGQRVRCDVHLYKGGHH